ncbi:MAG: ABC transporter permease [Dehalococcoidia bacterium]|nr:ABC transporter permease [Dehalococcoidia bacterium]
MVSVARQNLLHEKSKVALSISGVVLSVFLIFATLGLYNGIITVVENMTTKSGADLWVTSRGSSGSLHSPSLLNTGIGERLRQIPDVNKVAALIRRPVATTLNGEKVLININGFDTITGLGGPWKMVGGSARPANGEIVIDRVLARKYALRIGGTLALEGKQFKIIGLSDETFNMISYLVFVTADDARSFLPSGLTNFFLVKTAPSADIASVKASITSALPDVSVATADESAQDAKNETVGGFLPIVMVISAVGVLVGILVVGLLVYTMTVEKSQEYGVLRALGSTDGYLYRIVLFQALAVAVLGFAAGAVVSPPLIALIRYLVPEFVVEITVPMVLWSLVLFIATGIIASFIPLRRLSRIDPAIVFKGK